MNFPQFFIYNTDQTNRDEMLNLFTHPKDLSYARSRFQNTEQIKSFLFNRYFLRKSLGIFISSKAWKKDFNYTNQGKPFLDGEKWEFNLSHSKDQLLVGIHYGAPIGVDIEFMDNDISYREISTYFMHPREYKEFTEIPKSSRSEYFYSLWVQKEAFLKMKGTGFQADPCKIYIGFGSNKSLGFKVYCFSFKQNFRVGIVYES